MKQLTCRETKTHFKSRFQRFLTYLLQDANSTENAKWQAKKFAGRIFTGQLNKTSSELTREVRRILPISIEKSKSIAFDIKKNTVKYVDTTLHSEDV